MGVPAKSYPCTYIVEITAFTKRHPSLLGHGRKKATYADNSNTYGQASRKFFLGNISLICRTPDELYYLL